MPPRWYQGCRCRHIGTKVGRCRHIAASSAARAVGAVDNLVGTPTATRCAPATRASRGARRASPPTPRCACAARRRGSSNGSNNSNDSDGNDNRGNRDDNDDSHDSHGSHASHDSDGSDVGDGGNVGDIVDVGYFRDHGPGDELPGIASAAAAADAAAAFNALPLRPPLKSARRRTHSAAVRRGEWQYSYSCPAAGRGEPAAAARAASPRAHS
eukprot:gene8840-biopygen11881